MPYTLQHHAPGGRTSAAALLAASRFVYLPDDETRAAFRDELGLVARLISVDNTQAYLATDDDHLLVVFRGSEEPTSLDGLKDWLLTDAANFLIHPSGPLAAEFAAAGAEARFHQGFTGAITEIWPELFPAIAAELQRRVRPIWLTGHSLGGALAVLAGWLLRQRSLDVHAVVTFGGPMLSNRAAAESIGRALPGKIFRYVHTPDPIPLLPMPGILSGDYVHCDQMVALGSGPEAPDLSQYLKAAAREVFTGLLSGDPREKLWRMLEDKASAHFLAAYRSFLE